MNATATRQQGSRQRQNQGQQRNSGQQNQDQQQPWQNVGETERWASAAGGTALALLGLTRPTFGGVALTLLGGALMYRGLTGHCSMYQALGVSTSCPRGARTSIPAGEGVKIEEAMFIQRPAAELYRYWRDFENLPTFMHHLASVEELAGNRSHWVAKTPLGMGLAWDAEVINDRPGEVIAWRSLPGSEVDCAGSVHFEEAGDQRTRVSVVMKYDLPGGCAADALARMFGQAPEQILREDLQRFKQQVEAGSMSSATKKMKVRKS